MARTLAVLSDFASAAKELDATWLDAATTAAARDASNGRVFAMMAHAVGVPVRIISGDEEATLSTLSVTAEPPPGAGDLVVLDIGGGSTELVACSAHGKVETRVSLPIGSVRLTEACVRGDVVGASELEALRQTVRRALKDAHPPNAPFAMVGLAGTITSLAAVHLGLTTYDSKRIHDSKLPAAAVNRLLEKFAAMSLAERQQVTGLEPKRADVIVAGTCIVSEVLSHYGVDELWVSDRGLRWGLLRNALAATKLTTD